MSLDKPHRSRDVFGKMPNEVKGVPNPEVPPSGNPEKQRQLRLAIASMTGGLELQDAFKEVYNFVIQTADTRIHADAKILHTACERVRALLPELYRKDAFTNQEIVLFVNAKFDLLHNA